MTEKNFEVQFKNLTKAEGFNVILNCLIGKEINASLRLLSMFARLIHLSEIKMGEREAVSKFVSLLF